VKLAPETTYYSGVRVTFGTQGVRSTPAATAARVRCMRSNRSRSHIGARQACARWESEYAMKPAESKRARKSWPAGIQLTRDTIAHIPVGTHLVDDSHHDGGRAVVDNGQHLLAGRRRVGSGLLREGGGWGTLGTSEAGHELLLVTTTVRGVGVNARTGCGAHQGWRARAAEARGRNERLGHW
jgi:hypothetical protein